MNLRIQRRRFGQLAIASAATAAITNLAGKVVAQSSSGTLFSATVSSPSNPSNPNLTPAISVQSFNVTSGQQLVNIGVPSTTVSNSSTPVDLTPKSTSTELPARLTGLTTLSDGTLAKTTVSSSQNSDVTQLIITNPTNSQVVRTVNLTGLPNNGTVESILAPKNNNNLLAVISLNGGIPPFQLGTINPTTGQVTDSTNAGLPALNPNPRYSNLTQASDGTIYGTTLGREGTTYLVRINLSNNSITRVVQLSYNGKPLSNDVLSLAFSPSGQLYALANPNYQSTNSLFAVNIQTGVLSPIRQLNAEQITF
jgi:hypothetical protein